MVAAARNFGVHRQQVLPARMTMGWSSRMESSRVDWASLISRVAARADREAFKELFDHFAPRIKGFMIQSGLDPEGAEEIAQETLATVWKKASRYDPAAGDASAWIYTIARNLKIDAARRAIRFGKAVGSAELESAEYFSWTTPDVERHEDGVRVREALLKLPTDQKIAIRMAYLEERPHSEIAAELRIPLGTVKSRLRLAMGRLRTLLGDKS